MLFKFNLTLSFKIFVSATVFSFLVDKLIVVSSLKEKLSSFIKKNRIHVDIFTTIEQLRYAKGWTPKKVGKQTVIHNRTDYQLTHLLENGHDVISHGKKVGHFDGITHIAPVEKQVIEKMTEEVEKGIDNL